MKPSIPKGTRDFSSTEMARRNYIFDTIKKYFRLYGFEQIETPAMENLTTLTGKYGEEGDQLLFKILNSRVHESKEKEKLLSEFQLSLENSRNTTTLTERALRYDLTVPFARYVVMHQHEITFPFKRFQMQTVWRADKPQKGRYREFYQCDADIIGSNSLINEIELIKLMDDVYTELNIPVTIKINNRKVLQGIAEFIGEPEKIIDITIAIDKLDKVGQENVIKELIEKGISKDKVEKIINCINLPAEYFNRSEEFLQNNTQEEMKGVYYPDLVKINRLDNNFLIKNDEKVVSEIGRVGCKELRDIFKFFSGTELKSSKLEFDPSLARGLNYYTGAIFEVKVNDPKSTFTPSITGGGRYDDLTGIFGLPNMSGVGISFGIDRIYDVMEELDLFKDKIKNTASTDILFLNMGDKEASIALDLISQLRKENISASLYPDPVKEKKQFEYAQKTKVPFICVVRENDTATSQFEFKSMITREGGKFSISEIIDKVKQK